MRKTSLRKPIPQEMREQLAADPYMKSCILYPTGECQGRIEWNHAVQYAGKRINELWAIIPMCVKHHREEAQWRFTINGEVRNRIHHFAAEKEFRLKYPRSTLL